MANDENAFREVDEAMAEERQWAFFRENGPMLIAGAVAIVLGVAAWQIWTSHRASSARDASITFNSAVKTLASSPEDGREALKALAEDAPSGYAALADMRLGASLAGSGDNEGALAAYRRVYKDGGAPKSLRDLARLHAAMLSLADGRDAVISDLGPLPEASSSFGYYAREISAVAALGAKDYEAAYEMFSRAAGDLDAPEPVRQRAEELAALAAAGKAGVNLTGETRVEDLMKALGEDQKTLEEKTAPTQEPGAGATEEGGDETAAADGAPAQAADATQSGGDPQKDQ